MALQDVRQWRIGEVEITRIVEVAAYPAPIGMLLEGAGPEIFAPYEDWLRPHFISEAGEMLMQWQAFAVRTPGRLVMVDTCIGNDRKLYFEIFNDMQTAFLEDLHASGINPLEVDTVCCTHLHYDHVGWNTRLVDGKWIPTFPNARYLFDTTEYAEIRHLQEIGDWHGAHLPDAIDPIVQAGLHEFISAPGYRVCDEIRFEHTPGHTAGHCAVYVESKGERAVITGDLMHHPVQCAIPDRHGAFDHDPSTGSVTRRKFVEQNADGAIMVIGSHFSGPSAGWIIRDGETWRFVTEPPGGQPAK
jgi:glyoxylase-like metal-dependent hydrolase (beta-lactamase superfamily II)